MDKKLKRKMIVVSVATVLLAFAVFLSEKFNARVAEATRNDYGEGPRTDRYVVTVGEEFSEQIDIEINDRKYSAEEMKAVFQKAMNELDKIILGENESADHVEKDLNLVTRMPDMPIEIEWESNRSEIINGLGEIQEENLKESGELVELHGLLTYGEEECLYIKNVMVYPLTLTHREKVLSEIRKKTALLDESEREKKTVSLPREVGGQKIVWERPKENKEVTILIIGGVVVFMLWVQEKQKSENEKKERQRQMKIDYPEIVSQISLLVGAGLTMKNAWKKVVMNYQEHKEEHGVRYAYEEMNYTLREMQGGITEVESYERFGRRCGLSIYMKLGALLSQNLRKGSKGLVQLLAYESEQAFEERKQLARKQGEEASTKLLLPMSLMLIIVLVIVMVPALLSISL